MHRDGAAAHAVAREIAAAVLGPCERRRFKGNREVGDRDGYRCPALRNPVFTFNAGGECNCVCLLEKMELVTLVRRL